MSYHGSDLFSVRGKTVLVTSGSSGIGMMIASVFAANGAKVYIAGSKEEQLVAAAEDISAFRSCVPLVADLSQDDGIATLVREFAMCEDRLDILVNSAGATWGEAIESFPESGWDAVMDLNVKTPFFLSQKLLPMLTRAASAEVHSRIINLGSVAARLVDVSSPSYGASKAAIEQLTRIMARGFAKHRVTVNAIAPGWFPSRTNATVDLQSARDWIEATPLGRLGTAEDVGGLAMFLASPAGAYVNGQTIVLDGGRTL